MADEKGIEGKIRTELNNIKLKNRQISNLDFANVFHEFRSKKRTVKQSYWIRRIGEKIDAQMALIGREIKELHEKYNWKKGDAIPDAMEKEFQDLLDISFELPVNEKIKISESCSELDIKYLGAFVEYTEA